MKKHVAILMGGKSAEREVSFSSGKSIALALKSLGHQVTEVDPDENLSETLRRIKPDVVYNSLHGTYGEDGAIPGMLEILEIPYTHSGVFSSAVGLNKEFTRRFLKSHGIRFAKGEVFKVSELLKEGWDPMPRPYVIKPISQGSSVGVYIIKDGSPSFAAMQTSSTWEYGAEALVEEYIPGIEISTAVVGNNAIGTLELRPKSGFYDYEAKYTDGKTDHIYPAELPKAVYEESLKFAETAHRLLGCRTVSRSDMRYNPENGLLYYLEINTHPGFTNLSIVPEIAAKNGINFGELVGMILDDARLDLKIA